MHVFDSLENVVSEMQRQICSLNAFIHFDVSILLRETGATAFEGKAFMLRLLCRWRPNERNLCLTRTWQLDLSQKPRCTDYTGGLVCLRRRQGGWSS